MAGLAHEHAGGIQFAFGLDARLGDLELVPRIMPAQAGGGAEDLLLGAEEQIAVEVQIGVAEGVAGAEAGHAVGEQGQFDGRLGRLQQPVVPPGDGQHHGQPGLVTVGGLQLLGRDHALGGEVMGGRVGELDGVVEPPRPAARFVRQADRACVDHAQGPGVIERDRLAELADRRHGGLVQDGEPRGLIEGRMAAEVDAADVMQHGRGGVQVLHRDRPVAANVGFQVLAHPANVVGDDPVVGLQEAGEPDAVVGHGVAHQGRCRSRRPTGRCCPGCASGGDTGPCRASCSTMRK